MHHHLQGLLLGEQRSHRSTGRRTKPLQKLSVWEDGAGDNSIVSHNCFQWPWFVLLNASLHTAVLNASMILCLLCDRCPWNRYFLGHVGLLISSFRLVLFLKDIPPCTVLTPRVQNTSWMHTSGSKKNYTSRDYRWYKHQAPTMQPEMILFLLCVPTLVWFLLRIHYELRGSWVQNT